MYPRWLIVLFLLCSFAGIFAQVGEIRLTVTVPQNTPKDAKLYIAGDFNGWNAADPFYELHKQKNTYSGLIKLDSGTRISYKITRGSWDTVEKDKNGSEINNRTAILTRTSQKIAINIENWRDMTEKPVEHTITGHVEIIEHFPIPQLNTTRRVWIYLPPDYETSGKKYPTLYMQDGQNVFDAATSFVGEWQVDETMESLFKEQKCAGIIVIAIDNAGSDRMNEYSPWKNDSFGGGKGNQYAEFLALSLKPYIDSHFRTLKDNRFTGIAGSSMGAFISLYTALRYPEVFGKVAAFSTAFWFSKFPMREQIKLTGAQPNMRVYLYVGTDEGDKPEMKETYVRDTREIYQLIGASGYAENNLRIIVTEKAQHNEAAWAKEFPDAILWLYEDN
jgi:predicted alpha/beta superfamily hydrolase